MEFKMLGVKLEEIIHLRNNMRYSKTFFAIKKQPVEQGVQKISKIVNNGSILVVRHAVERLGKNKQFQRRKKIQKSVLWSPTQPLKMKKKGNYYIFFDKA